MILGSSGSTGSPKLIPRTDQNIVSFCREFIAGRAVTPADRGLSLARTTSSQGLHILATTIFAGASLVVVPDSDRRALGTWVRELRPTYVSTTPAVLRAIAAERAVLHGTVLRCIFATSAPLLAEEAKRLESALGAPILNMYGLTEATGIAGERYPESAGVPLAVGPAWCDVEVIAEGGERLGPHQLGEILVRGPRVFPGYLDNPDLNAAAFLPGGWLRTGDIGFLDEAGYVYLRGRLGEIVNRGGDKIDPGEVDAVLRAYPGVDDAGAFAVPDQLLGEDIVAAVVLAPSASATARQLRAWTLDHLPPYKSPRRIWFVADLPRTNTGKISLYRVAGAVSARGRCIVKRCERGRMRNRNGGANRYTSVRSSCTMSHKTHERFGGLVGPSFHGLRDVSGVEDRMDGQRFDELARLFSAPLNRKRFLAIYRRLASASAALSDDGAAKKRKKRNRGNGGDGNVDLQGANGGACSGFCTKDVECPDSPDCICDLDTNRCQTVLCGGECLKDIDCGELARVHLRAGRRKFAAVRDRDLRQVLAQKGQCGDVAGDSCVCDFETDLCVTIACPGLCEDNADCNRAGPGQLCLLPRRRGRRRGGDQFGGGAAAPRLLR